MHRRTFRYAVGVSYTHSFHHRHRCTATENHKHQIRNTKQIQNIKISNYFGFRYSDFGFPGAMHRVGSIVSVPLSLGSRPSLNLCETKHGGILRVKLSTKGDGIPCVKVPGLSSPHPSTIDAFFNSTNQHRVTFCKTLELFFSSKRIGF